MRHRSRHLPLVCLALLVALLVPTPAQAIDGSASLVFINEIHYDNAGTDVGEAIEITGPAGTDLTGWSVVRYNGSGGTVYGTDLLSGPLVDDSGGYGFATITYPANGLQNGAPDGVALVDPSGTVVQFLSYEGSFAATGGPASGQTSTDIGVAESSGTAAGSSLALTGTGSSAGHFTWVTGTASFGSVNDGQILGGAPPVDVAISEFHYDNGGGDVGEFVEVEGAAGRDLSGWSLVLYNGSNRLAYQTIDLGGVIDDEGAGRGAVSFLTPGLQNGSPDGMALIDDTGAAIEFWSYEGSFTAADGPAAGLASTDVGVFEASSTPIGQSLQLVGGVWTGPTAESPGVLNRSTPVPEIVITEIMQNPSAVSDGAGEWVEVYNAGSVDVDLDGWTIADDDFDSHTITGTVVVPGGGHAVLGRNADPVTNGGVAIDYQYSGLFLGNSADEVVLTTSTGAEVDRVEYDGGTTFPDPNGASMSLGDVDADNNVGANWCESRSAFGAGDRGTPGAANDLCLTSIHEAQGRGPVAALSGQTINAQGIVTALFTRDDRLDGFFLQEEDADVDTDPATSEGIFVFCRANCPGSLAAGDLVTVTGQVGDYFGMSQISSNFSPITIESSGNPLPTPTPLALPALGSTSAEATFEAVEGMLVGFTGKLVVSEYFQLARYGQVVLTAEARPEQFTDANAPSVAGHAAFLDDLATRRIILDDDNNDQNDTIFDAEFNEFSPWPVGGISTTNYFRGGDSITGLTGVLHWSWAGQSGTDAWRVRPVTHPTIDYTFIEENPRQVSPADVGGSLTVAAFNVLNYFTTLDDGGPICGPANDQGCRGANSAAELDRQRDKIVAALTEIDADIVGLVEIENDSGAATADLVAALNRATAPGTYAAIDSGTIGGDAIKVALVYQPASVFPVGDHTVLDSSIDPRFNDDKNRPVLIQTFEEIDDGGRLTVAVNHLKSKGSPCDDVGDPNLGDGQGNCNQTRTAAAEALADHLAGDPTDSFDGDVLILGDLNAYAMEDPITALEAAGYTDLVEAHGGSSAYSYAFDGQLGYLDYALANASLADQVTGTTVWPINADEVNLFDYNDDIRDPNERSFERESSNSSPYAPDAFRSSDHDPVIVGLDLIPQCDGLAATIVGTLGDDNIKGTSGDDVIVARGGNDIVHSGRGEDVICGDQGDDELHGQNEADAIFGGRGDDTLIGGARDDLLDGQLGTNSLDGGGGTDTCVNGALYEACEL